MSDTYFLIFGIVVAILGLLMVIGQLRMFLLCRTETDAEITSVKKETTKVRGSSIHSFRPQFSYKINDKQYEGTAPFTTKKKDKYNPGDVLRILVSEAHPEMYRFKGRVGTLVAGIAVLGAGLLFVILYFA